MNFEWDPGKAAINLRKHGVSFDEAGSVFLDSLAVSGSDPEHSARITLHYVWNFAFGTVCSLFHTPTVLAPFESSLPAV